MKIAGNPVFFFCAVIGLTVLALFYAGAQNPVITLGYQRSHNEDWIGYNAQNTIKDSMWLTEPHLVDRFPELHPKIIRYPGGGVANWWDWKPGWFMVSHPNIPLKYKNLPPKVNDLDSLKKVCDVSGATPMFVLNMISSDLPYQLEMLEAAKAKGLPVKYVELGNEFYLEEDVDSTFIYSIFPDGATYGTVASEWIDSIHKYHPEAKVAAIGAFNRNNNSRRKAWDTSMLKTLEGQDAISYHSYYSAASLSEEEQSELEDTFTLEMVPEMLYRPDKMWNILSKDDMPLIPPSNEIWMTEFNLQDHNLPVHGSWAHALFLSKQTMNFMYNGRIKHLAVHAICGSAVYGMFFNYPFGFQFGGDGLFVPPKFPPDSTQFWGLTAGGRALEVLGKALHGMTRVATLEFRNGPLITTIDIDDTVTYNGLYGWIFTSDTATHAVILNLTDTSHTLRTKYAFPNTGSYATYHARANQYIAYEDDVRSTYGKKIPKQLEVEPYSITYLRSKSTLQPAPEVHGEVLGNPTVCEGDSIMLDAGADYVEYRWSTGESTRSIWVTAGGIYTVQGRSQPNGFWGIDTLVVETLFTPKEPKLELPAGNEICEGTGDTLFVKSPEDTLVYQWSTGAAGEFLPVDAGGDYYVTAVASNGCSSVSETASIVSFPEPHPVVTPEGPIEACYDVDITLDAGPGWKSYTWPGGKVGQTFSPDTSGVYFVVVKDSNNCTGTSNSVSVTIYEPAEPVITVNGVTTYCEGSNSCELLTVAGYAYQWQKSGNDIEGATDVSFTPLESGNYKVVVSDQFGCTKKSEVVEITVLDTPSTNITVDGPKKICEGEETTNLVSKECIGCSIQWYKDGSMMTGETGTVLLVSEKGDYFYTALSPEQCLSISETQEITGGGCREPSSSIPGMDVRLYPNPASGWVVLEMRTPGCPVVYVELINELGVVCNRESVTAESGSADVRLSINALPKGMYVIQVACGLEKVRLPLVVE